MIFPSCNFTLSSKSLVFVCFFLNIKHSYRMQFVKLKLNTFPIFMARSNPSFVRLSFRLVVSVSMLKFPIWQLTEASSLSLSYWQSVGCMFNKAPRHPHHPPGRRRCWHRQNGEDAEQCHSGVQGGRAARAQPCQRHHHHLGRHRRGVIHWQQAGHRLWDDRDSGGGRGWEYASMLLGDHFFLFYSSGVNNLLGYFGPRTPPTKYFSSLQIYIFKPIW